MGFALLLPLGLLALVAIPIVVILHMRNTTPVTRPIPTLRFWLAAEPERSESRRLRRPPITLVLLLQLLIVGLLAAGLGRPAAASSWSWLGLDLRAEREHVIVLLDGSTSMTAVDTGEDRRWETARAIALDEISALREGDAATVLLLGTRTTTLEATDAAGFTVLRQRLATLELPGGRADLSAGLDLAGKLLLPGLQDRVVVISDGAVTADPAVLAALGAPVSFEQIETTDENALPNVGVTQLSARTDPTQPGRELVYARIANFSSEPVDVPVVLYADEIESSRQPVTIPGNGGTTELQWLLPSGVRRVDVRIERTDVLPIDNEASLILRQGSDLSLDILLVSDIPGPLARALEVLPGARVTTEAPGSPGALAPDAGYDLVVYEGVAPPEVLPDAALLLVQPPIESGPFPTRGQMTTPTVTNLVADDPLLRGVDISGLTFGPTPVYEMMGDQTPVVSAEAGPLLLRGTLRGQPMVALTFDLAASNLTQRVAFPILIANIAADLVPTTLPPSVPLGDPLSYRPGNGTETVEITMPDSEIVPIAVAVEPGETAGGATSAGSDRLGSIAFASTGLPGIYAVTEYAPDGESLGGGQFVVNAGHPTESDLRVTADLADTLSLAATTVDGESATGMADLWPLLIAAAIVVLAVEWLIAIWPRRARRSAPVPVSIGMERR